MVEEAARINTNIFFTGERGVGKSTLLKRLLAGKQLNSGGFKTLPFSHRKIGRGFYLLASQESPLPAPEPNRIIALRSHQGRIEKRFTTVFETLGVSLLNDCLEKDIDLIIMDELGFLENEALKFQQAVHRCLNLAIPVWGVIKPMASPFLDSVRERKDVSVFTVTLDNRDQLYHKFMVQSAKSKGYSM